jgi:uncharacterized protein (DUF2141 family)
MNSCLIFLSSLLPSNAFMLLSLVSSSFVALPFFQHAPLKKIAPAVAKKMTVRGSGRLTVIVHDVKKIQGHLRLVLYNSAANFLEKRGFSHTQSKTVEHSGSLRFEFDLPHAYYALTCYQDLNSNHLMDRSSLGTPVEPYAMSNNVNVKWRKPTFEETKIPFSQPHQTIEMGLKEWKDQ